MPWNVEYTDEFGAWYEELQVEVQDATTGVSGCSKPRGRSCRFRIRRASRDRGTATCASCACKAAGILRVFYAFDPRRSAILLIGGDKTGIARFYETMIPLADRLYDVYLEELRKEGLIP